MFKFKHLYVNILVIPKVQIESRIQLFQTHIKTEIRSHFVVKNEEQV